MKVAIVARAGTSSLAPWRDTSWEIWGLPWIRYPRITRMFDVHTQTCMENCGNDYYVKDEWLDQFHTECPNTPVYCDKTRASKYKNAIEYPFEEIINFLPQPYLENSIAYQLALAIKEGAEEIGLWGVHMMARIEIEYERPSVTYLIGLAEGRGIKVYIPPGNPLFMSKYVDGRYGINEGDAAIRKPILFASGTAVYDKRQEINNQENV